MKSRLVELLKQETRLDFRRLLVGFTIIGVTNALVLVFVHDATSASEPGANIRLLLMFAICVAIFSYTKKTVSVQLTERVQQAISQLRIRILDKIQHARLEAFEHLDRSQLINAVSENTLVIVDGAKHFAQGVPAGIMLICSFIYVAYLSMPALYIVVICVSGCAWVVWRLNRSVAADLSTSLRKEDDFLTSFHELMDGFKELKMDRAKNRDLLENYLRRSSVEARLLNTKTAVSIIDSEIYTYIFFYILLGAILFVLPRISDITPQNMLAVTTILLFLLGNGTVFVQALPNITKTDAAIENILRLEAALHDLEPPPEELPPSPWPPALRGDLVVSRLHFAYPGPQERAFSVELDELRIPAGELLFIQGGNGSGKSTLLKLLTGLYTPTQGSIRLGGVAVTELNLQPYRESFGIVFSDFHLFDRLYGRHHVDEGRLVALLNEMGIAGKTHYADGRFSNLSLSTGQRKRLALVVALLEDKPIYVFDEVAADQDPQFKRYFYEHILPGLKGQGKTVIAVTHDDRYFSAADRVLKMEYGRIVSG